MAVGSRFRDEANESDDKEWFELIDVPWGMDRGYPTTKRALKPRPSQRKGKPSKRRVFVKNIIREVAGHAPYERRLIELLRWAVSPFRHEMSES